MRKLTLTLNEAEISTLEQLVKAHTKEYFRLAVQRLMSSSMVILIMCSCVNYDLCRFLVGHYRNALIAVNQGQDIATVAAVLRISGESIRTWIHSWERHGLVGILNARAGGRQRLNALLSVWWGPSSWRNWKK